jgi:hypothetical protein
MDRYDWIVVVWLFAMYAVAGLTSCHEEEPCVTDSQCFIQCEKEKGRPCTDEDVFGPAEDGGNDPDDGEECINPDGQNWCENERKAFLR